MAENIKSFVLFLCIFGINIVSPENYECPLYKDFAVEKFNDIAKHIAPPLLQGKAKGDAGKIGVIGGSTEYTGAPYFAAISALKIGADLVYVVTTAEASPVIKSYSPDLIVYPYLNVRSANKISTLIQKMDVVVIGPGLGREDETMTLIEDILTTCKSFGKPLVIDADGLYAVSKNPDLIKDYPSPGIIMTPNQRETNKLQKAVSRNDSNWFNFWGDHVSVLVKGATDQFHSSIPEFDWSSSQGGTGRRAAGQGDILSGSLGTVFGWAINNCDTNNLDKSVRAQSIATYAVAKFIRMCNSKAFDVYGRSMTASDMLGQIHNSYEDIFEH